MSTNNPSFVGLVLFHEGVVKRFPGTHLPGMDLADILDNNAMIESRATVRQGESKVRLRKLLTEDELLDFKKQLLEQGILFTEINAEKVPEQNQPL